MSSILKFLRENHILALIEQAVAKKKSQLCLNAFEISEIPPLLYTCLEVEHLYLHRNKISIVPVELSQLTNLTTLTLDYNNITSLPSEIGNLKNLVNLNLSYNPLKVLIPEIGNLENLEAFWCNKIGLKEIPKEIGKLEKLDTFGARGNEIISIPEEMTKLSKLRWLTLENNQIEQMPNTMHEMEALVHCNLRNNRLKEFPLSVLRCHELMFLQLNNNHILVLPEDVISMLPNSLEMVDLRENPICDQQHPEHPLLRYTEAIPEPSLSSRAHAAAAASVLAINATALRLPAVPGPRHHPIIIDNVVAELELDSSLDSSEDWENSVNSSDLDVQYQSDEERVDNEEEFEEPIKAEKPKSYFSRRVGSGYTLQSDPTKRGEYYIEVRVSNSRELEALHTNRWKHSLLSFKTAVDEKSSTWRAVSQLVAAVKEDYRGIRPILYGQNSF